MTPNGKHYEAVPYVLQELKAYMFNAMLCCIPLYSKVESCDSI